MHECTRANWYACMRNTAGTNVWCYELQLCRILVLPEISYADLHVGLGVFAGVQTRGCVVFQKGSGSQDFEQTEGGLVILFVLLGGLSVVVYGV